MSIRTLWGLKLRTFTFSRVILYNPQTGLVPSHAILAEERIDYAAKLPHGPNR